jgi:predicted SnoaL-like aldol condensation-catalyzing enzyme
VRSADARKTAIHDAVTQGPDQALARPAQAFPPNGKWFATSQTHWFRIADGKITEHWSTGTI